MDEKDLIQLAAEGDLPAFEQLVQRKRERVFWIAYNLVGDAELARDVSQEVFLRLYRVLRRFRKGGRFDAWLYRITLHLAIDAFRRERPHRGATPLDEVSEGSLATGRPRAGSPYGGTGGGADDSPTGEPLRQREVRRIFMALTSMLTPRQRHAFILREIEGLSTTEVAEILKTRPSTVRNHVLQARRVLQDELRRRYPEYCRPPAPPKTGPPESD